MKRVDEVGQKRTGNNYWVVGSWGGGPDKLVVSTQSVDHDPNGGGPTLMKIILGHLCDSLPACKLPPQFTVVSSYTMYNCTCLGWNDKCCLKLVFT